MPTNVFNALYTCVFISNFYSFVFFFFCIKKKYRLLHSAMLCCFCQSLFFRARRRAHERTSAPPLDGGQVTGAGGPFSASLVLWLRCPLSSWLGEMGSGNARIWSVRDPISWVCEWRQNRTLNLNFRKVCFRRGGKKESGDDGCAFLQGGGFVVVSDAATWTKQ